MLAMCVSTTGVSANAEETVVTDKVSAENSWDGVTTVNNYTGENFNVTFLLENHWEDSYNATIRVENTGSSVNETFAGFPKEYKLLGESAPVQEDAYSVEYILDNDWETYKSTFFFILGRLGGLMKEKLVDMVKKYWVIPVSLLLLLPVASMGALLLYITISITGVEWFGFLFSYGVSGIIISLPVIVKVGKSNKIKKGVKAVIIVLTVFLFTVISYMLFWYKKFP